MPSQTFYQDFRSQPQSVEQPQCHLYNCISILKRQGFEINFVFI